jgi:hypothetical protein
MVVYRCRHVIEHIAIARRSPVIASDIPSSISGIIRHGREVQLYIDPVTHDSAISIIPNKAVITALPLISLAQKRVDTTNIINPVTFLIPLNGKNYANHDKHKQARRQNQINAHGQ